ncbi:MAG: hypothetical protein AB7G75_37255 [Candidatus Binatia bacterium]
MALVGKKAIVPTEFTLQWRSHHQRGRPTSWHLGRWLMVGLVVLLVTVASAQAQIQNDEVGRQQQRLKSIKYELDWLTYRENTPRYGVEVSHSLRDRLNKAVHPAIAKLL